MNKVTIVSALFDINRDEIDGRKWEEYLNWFEITLKLKCPMVLFVTEDVREFVENRRLSVPTEICVQSVEDIPYFYLKSKIDSIISSNEYVNKIKDPTRIECNHSMYSIIQYSKFKWLERVVIENPFDSEYFFWLDSGGSRFFEDYDLGLSYPSESALESLEEMGDKFLVQMNMEYYPELSNSELLGKEYLLDNRSYILGSMFGGGIQSVKNVSKFIEDIFVNEMVNNGFVNNEQIALGYLVKNKSDYFEFYERYNGKHMDLFSELGKL